MSRKGWESGTASIIARRNHDGLYRGEPATGETHWVYDYVADVTPDGGGEMFRATLTERFKSTEQNRPDVGDHVPVKCHPADKQAEFDRAALRAKAATPPSS
jgi:hypothetical protein